MGRIWAVCRHTLIECLRARVTGVFLVALAVVILLLPLAASGTDARSQVQTFLAYSVAVSMLVLSVLTILLGCGLLSREIENRNIFAPLTKPVARWQYVLGRWLGVVLGQTVALVFVGLVIYGTTHYLRAQAPGGDTRAQLDEQVLCARLSRGLEGFDELRDELVQKRLGTLVSRAATAGEPDPIARAEEAGPRAVEALERDLRRWAVTQLQTAPAATRKGSARGDLQWVFTGLTRPDDPEATIQFRFRADVAEGPPDEKLYCRLVFETPEPKKADSGLRRMRAHSASEPYDVTMLVDVPKTVTLPARLISDDGELGVRFSNHTTMPVEIDHREMVVLYLVGGFAFNFVRGLLLVLCLQMFLAAFAVLAGSWLSFPVAALACFVFFVIGMMASFITESTELGPKSDASIYLGHYAAAAVLTVLPDFQAANPAGALVDGTLIPWWGGVSVSKVNVSVSNIFFWSVLKSGVALGIACLVFTFRELARVTA